MLEPRSNDRLCRTLMSRQCISESLILTHIPKVKDVHVFASHYTASAYAVMPSKYLRQ